MIEDAPNRTGHASIEHGPTAMASTPSSCPAFEIKVLSMASATARRSRMAAMLDVKERGRWSFFDPLPAEQAPLGYDEIATYRKYGSVMSPAELSCAASHMRMIMEFLDRDDLEYLAVLEDDVLLDLASHARAVRFSTRANVTTGEGVNMYFSSLVSWDHPDAARRLAYNILFLARATNRFGNLDGTKAVMHQRYWGWQKEFMWVLVRKMVRDRVIDLSLVRDLVRERGALAASLPAAFLAALMRRPYGDHAPGTDRT